jgi:hypothetical protein
MAEDSGYRYENVANNNGIRKPTVPAIQNAQRRKNQSPLHMLHPDEKDDQISMKHPSSFFVDISNIIQMPMLRRY